MCLVGQDMTHSEFTLSLDVRFAVQKASRKRELGIVFDQRSQFKPNWSKQGRIVRELEVARADATQAGRSSSFRRFDYPSLADIRHMSRARVFTCTPVCAVFANDSWNSRGACQSATDKHRLTKLSTRKSRERRLARLSIPLGGWALSWGFINRRSLFSFEEQLDTVVRVTQNEW